MNQLRAIVLRVLTTHVAWPILLTIALLCIVSHFALEPSFPQRAATQRIHVAVGLLVLLAMLLPHYNHLGRVAYAFFALTLLLLMAVMGAAPQNGARRWFDLGVLNFQPSELAKIAYVLALAWVLRYRKNLSTLRGLLVPFLLMLVPFGLILIEPDLGTALLFPLVLYTVLVAAGARFRHLLVIALVAVLAAPGAYPLLKPYQQERVKSVLRHFMGDQDPNRRMREDFQSWQSKIAIGSGGAMGQGGSATQQIRQGVLPEADTDFVFSVIGAQWGFAGCGLVLLLYLAFFAACIEIAATTNDLFARLLVVGLASMILFQATINIAMTVALAPVVGITLPFVSYGGSSLLTNFFAAGLLLNVSVRRSAQTAANLQYAPTST